eukprot:TRINITY_DN14376_c0_g1_i1.p1 TRINITY_DN14376_c0_g1~~TRINITY_DN14376_c0_g1_i1.p1  ORF type:complete len:168 (+),score=17.85 TRINITY_DN14376_c0_g1_i1:114-617(+)
MLCKNRFVLVLLLNMCLMPLQRDAHEDPCETGHFMGTKILKTKLELCCGAYAPGRSLCRRMFETRSEINFTKCCWHVGAGKAEVTQTIIQGLGFGGYRVGFAVIDATAETAARIRWLSHRYELDFALPLAGFIFGLELLQNEMNKLLGGGYPMSQAGSSLRSVPLHS